MRELSLHLLDILENSIRAGATRIQVTVIEDSVRNRLIISVEDNGHGIEADDLAYLGDPFFTTRATREVGLGIALFREAAQRCNGDLTVESHPGVGTRVTAEFELNHIDRAPLGNVKASLLAALLLKPDVNIHYYHRVDEREFEFDTAEIRAALGDLPLDHPRVLDWLEKHMDNGFAYLYGEGEEERDAKAQISGGSSGAS